MVIGQTQLSVTTGDVSMHDSVSPFPMDTFSRALIQLFHNKSRRTCGRREDIQPRLLL